MTHRTFLTPARVVDPAQRSLGAELGRALRIRGRLLQSKLDEAHADIGHEDWLAITRLEAALEEIGLWAVWLGRHVAADRTS